MSRQGMTGDTAALTEALQMFSSVFYKILRVNLTDDSYEIIKEDVSEKKGRIGFSAKMSEWVRDFALAGQVHPDDVEDYLSFTQIEHLRAYFKSSQKPLQHQYRRKMTDDFVWVSMELMPTENYSDDCQEIMLYVRNIYDHHMCELHNRLAEQSKLNKRLGAQLDAVLGGIVGGLKISRDDNLFSYEYVSEGVAAIQGYTVEEFVEETCGSFAMNCYPGDLAQVRVSIAAQYDRGDTFSVRYRVRHKNGQICWVQDSGKKVLDEDGIVHHYILSQDITSLEGRNAALREASSIRLQMLDLISCGILAYTLPGHELFMINNVTRHIIEAYDENPMPRLAEFIRKDIIEENGEGNRDASDRLKKTGDSVRLLYQARRKDGSIMVVSNQIKLLELPDGQQYVLSSMIDVTEQERLNEILQKERKQYRDALTTGCEFCLLLDVTEGIIRDRIINANGEDIIGKIGLSTPVGYDELVSTYIEKENIKMILPGTEAYCTRAGLIDTYESGTTNAVAEFYNEYRDTYTRMVLLLSKDEWTGHIYLFVVAHNSTEARKKELEDAQKLKQQYAVTKSFSQVYFVSWVVDLEQEKMIEVNVPDYVHTIVDGNDGDLRIAFERMLRDYVADEYRDSYREFLDVDSLPSRMRGKNVLSFEYFGKLNGWCRANFIPMSESLDGDVKQLLFAVQGIDEERKREEQTKLALQQAYEAASKASRAKSDFLANMSHDIRTPMNAIVGMTAIAETHLEDRERVADCLHKIMVSSKHLLGLINEVLDMSKIESGKVDLQEEEFNLPDLTDNLLTMCKTSIEAKHQELDVSIQDIVHEKVIGDSRRIQQAFMNLIGNAVKYTPEGGTIKLYLAEKPTNRERVGCYEFIFEDNGIGMTKEFLGRIFEPFARADDKRVENTQGTGLGMAITRNIVQMMNGNIQVESELNKGTKFTVTIFLKLQDVDERVRLDELADLKVLVIDEDEAACETVCSLLKEIGMRGEAVYTVEDALSALEGNDGQEGFFAIIVDWRRADMESINVVKEIRQSAGSDPAIIVLSACDWSDVESKARAAGADAFMSKPLYKSRLAHLFSRMLGHDTEVEKTSPLDGFANGHFEGRRALLVEDNELNAEIAGEILGLAGIEVDYARNGKEAVDIMTLAQPGQYDIIFMDVQMPVMNGYQAARAIRELPGDYTRKVPILAMTANAFAEDVDAARSAGMNEHIAKPLDFKNLLKALERWLDK